MRGPALLTIVAAFALAAPSPARADDDAPLVVYTSLDPTEMQLYVDAFTRTTSISVRWVRLSTGEILTRVRSERQRPQASVWFGGSSAEFTFAAADGLLEAHHPKTFDQFRASTRDPEWRWMGMSESVVGFASNPRVLAEEGAKPPTAWRDLLKPEYRGLVSMAYAYTSGTAYTIVASLAQLFGERESLEYWRALDKNVHHYNRSGSACVMQVSLGEVGTCIAFTNDIINKGLEKGYPIVMTFPEEGAAFEVDSMALLAGAPHPEKGRRFLEWALSKEAQALLATRNRVPMRDDVPVSPRLPAKTVKRIDYSAAKAAGKRKQLVDLWREATGQ
ncbi:ABC transporter substrate-binding protein [Myxococcota bacterium]|nr:ABC transporter substrate-binding protein [Myxococcota bacterium]